jgi:hypothetical protein
VTARDEARRRERWLLAALMVAGAVLRAVTIEREALWGDEALTLMLARLPLFDLFFRPADPTPGLYYAIQHWLVPADPGRALARLPSWIAGCLTIPAAYWLGKAALDRRAGLWVAALVAVSPPLIHYSQEARAYALLVLLVTVSAAALVDAFPRGAEMPRAVRWSRIAIFAATGILAVYTHLVGWLWLVPAMALGLAGLDRRGAAPRLWLALGAALVAALAVPEAHRLAAYALSPRNEFYWLEQSDAATLVVILDWVLLPLPATSLLRWFRADWTSLLVVARNLALLLWLYLALRPNVATLGPRVKRRPVAAGVTLILLSIPLGAWLVGFVTTPILMPRTTLPALPGFLLLLAALARLWGGGRVILLLVLAYGATSVGDGLSRAKEPWPATVRLVAAQSQGRPLVLFCPAWRAAAFMTAAQERGTGGAAVVAFKHGQARLVSANLGRDPRWADHYVDLVMRPALPAYQARPAATRVATLGRVPAEVVIVRNFCPPAELQAMAAWLGSGNERAVALPPGLRGFGLDVAIFRPAGQEPRPLVVD